MSQRVIPGALVAIAAVGLFAMAFQFPRNYEISIIPMNPRFDQDAYKPALRRSHGVQFLLVFVGNSTCTWSSVDSLPHVVERLKLELSKEAAARGASFRAIGVATDWSADRGLAFLKRFGAFDEISVGGNWSNAMLIDYFWRLGIEPSTPSVAIYRREFAEAVDTLDTGVRVPSTVLLTVRKGANEIAALSRSSNQLIMMR